jgi:hypothetical protein
MFGKSKRRAAWGEVATALGGTHHLPSKWWRGDEAITATIDGVLVKLDTFTVTTGQSSQTYTRVAAKIALGPGVKSKCYREGFWSTLGKLVGLQDVKLGSPEFDPMYVVKAANVAVVRRWWTDRTRVLMMSVADGRITTDADDVKLVAGGRWREVPKIVAAMKLVGALAARDLYGVAVLQAIGGAFSQPKHDRPRVALDTGARVVVMAEDRDDQLVMGARVADQLPHAPLVLEVVDGRAEASSQLPQGAQVHLVNVGSGRLSIGETSVFLWNDFETDPARLRAGAALLGAFGAHEGVYR